MKKSKIDMPKGQFWTFNLGRPDTPETSSALDYLIAVRQIKNKVITSIYD
jgi:hypothetical protein